MSHLTQTTTQFRDIDALRTAVEKFGLTLTEGGECRFFSGRPKVDFLITLPGKYDVGFKRNADGTLDVVCDSELYKPTIYTGAKSEAYAHFGEKFHKLTDEYGIALVTTMYRRKGYSVTRGEAREDGSIKLTVQRG